MNLSKKIDNLNLDKLNFYAFLLHFISGIIIAGVLFGATGDIKFNTDLYGYKITNISPDGKTVSFLFGEGGPKVVNSSESLKAIIVTIFFLTAIFHLYYWKSKNYTKEINSGKNRIRWVEYAITASMMIYVYSILSGVKDLYSTFFIVCLNIVMMSFGYFLEITKDPQAKLSAIIMGFFILTLIFSVAYYQFVANIEVAKDTFDIPDWVYAIVIAMIFWWISFGVVAVLYYRASLKGKVDYKRYEKYYIFLSFVSKAFMGYYLTFGLTRDSPKEN
jgi:hypothetical protein